MEKWKDIVIRPSDKGSVIFVIGRKEYVQRILSHLSDPKTFTIIENKLEAVEQTIEAINQWTIYYAHEPGMTSASWNPTNQETTFSIRRPTNLAKTTRVARSAQGVHHSPRNCLLLLLLNLIRSNFHIFAKTLIIYYAK